MCKRCNETGHTIRNCKKVVNQSNQPSMRQVRFNNQVNAFETAREIWQEEDVI